MVNVLIRQFVYGFVTGPPRYDSLSQTHPWQGQSTRLGPAPCARDLSIISSAHLSRVCVASLLLSLMNYSHMTKPLPFHRHTTITSRTGWNVLSLFDIVSYVSAGPFSAVLRYLIAIGVLMIATFRLDRTLPQHTTPQLPLAIVPWPHLSPATAAFRHRHHHLHLPAAPRSIAPVEPFPPCPQLLHSRAVLAFPQAPSTSRGTPRA